MDISTLSTSVPVAPEAVIGCVVAALAVAAAFAIKPIIRKMKASLTGSDLLIVMAIIVAFGGAMVAIMSNGVVQERVASQAFQEKLKADYGVETDSSLSDVERAATRQRIIVLSDSSGSFEARPHLDGNTLTFFRVDNGSQVSPRA